MKPWLPVLLGALILSGCVPAFGQECLSGDCRNGQGTLTFPDGRRYVGAFRDNKANGQGTYTLADGGKYVGEFRDDEMNGQGTYTWPDGVQYAGEFRDDKMSGHGTYTWREFPVRPAVEVLDPAHVGGFFLVVADTNLERLVHPVSI